MKPFHLCLALVTLAVRLVGAAETTTPASAPATNTPPPTPSVAPPPATETPAAAAPAIAPPPADTDTNAAPAMPAPDLTSTNGLRLNFRGVPLDMVLNYLSEAAGFIIVLDAQPRGKVDVWSNQPLTRDEAVDLLNTVLNKNGFAAIRKGRTLTIVNKDEAKIKSIPVRTFRDPEAVPDNDELVTAIIPVQYVEVAQLIKDLQPLVSTQTPMTANESGNSIIITDTQANIRRVAQVIKDIDMGAEDLTVVRVFRLAHANPQEMSDLLTSLFPDDSRSGGSQAPMQFGGPGGGFRRFLAGMGGAQGASGGSQTQRIKKRARVIAVPDLRTASVVVTATKDLMDEIEGVVSTLDADNANMKSVAVIPLENAEPQDAMQVLQDIFMKSGTQNSRNAANQQNNALTSRSTQQMQQYNNANRSTSMSPGARSGVGGFGQ